MKHENIQKIEQILKEHKEELQKSYRIKEIGIFGSYIRGEHKDGSDLDILVEFEEQARISLLDFPEIENYLSDLLGSRLIWWKNRH